MFINSTHKNKTLINRKRPLYLRANSRNYNFSEKNHLVAIVISRWKLFIYEGITRKYN